MTHWKRILTIGLFMGLCLAIGNVCRAAEPVDVLMLGMHKPRPRDAFWPHFQEACAKAGVRVHILEEDALVDYDKYPLEFLKKFQVIIYNDRPEKYSFTTLPEEAVAAFRERLDAYHKAGGGIIWVPLATDSGALKWTNLVGQRYGAKALDERLYDPPKEVAVCPARPDQPLFRYMWTTNVTAHPVTNGVRGLLLPLTGEYQTAGTIPMQYGPEWTVLVRGMESTCTIEAGAAAGSNSTKPDPSRKGSYPTVPPVLAVREGQEGAGRMMVLPVHPSHTWLNFGHFGFNDAFMLNGDGVHPSDGFHLVINACQWLAEPARKAGLGGYKGPKRASAMELKPVDWTKADFQAESWSGMGGWWDDVHQEEHSIDKELCTPGARDFRGLFGVHSAASDGEGTVADYVAEAKKCGLSFLVFLEDLAKTDSDKYARLAADCKANSTADFLAVPGYQFRDLAGVLHYVFWTDKLPANDNLTEDRKVRVPVQITDQNSWKNGYGIGELAHSPVNPWRLFVFTTIAPYTWDVDKLVDDGLERNLRDEGFGMNYVPIGLVQVHRPSELATASKSAHLTVLHAQNLDLFQTTFTIRGDAHPSPVYLTNGPLIKRWGVLNPLGHAFWPGKERMRIGLDVQSEAGLREVVIRDANKGGIFRRFLLHGEKTFSCRIDETHRGQFYLVPVITDNNGRTALGSTLVTFQDGNRISMMGDRLMGIAESHGWDEKHQKLMTLGGWLGHMWTKPYIPAGFEPGNTRSSELKINGVDGGNFSGAAFDFDQQVNTAAGVEPAVQSFQFVNRLASFDYAVMDYDGQNQFLIKEPREAGGWWKTPEQEVPTQIADIQTRVWAVRARYNASVSANVHEMTVTFKKETQLKQIEVCKFRKSEASPTMLFIGDSEGEHTWWLEKKEAFNRTGVVPPGGYIYPANNRGGSPGLINLGPLPLQYQTSGATGSVFFDGKGRTVKAGETIKLRFVCFQKPWLDQLNNVWLDQFIAGFGIGTGNPGYTAKITRGSKIASNYSLDIAARNGGAVFEVKRYDLPHNLVVRVSGFPPNAIAGRYDLDRKQVLILPVFEGMSPTSIDTTAGDTRLYVGELLHVDNPEARISAVQDGADQMLVEIHNPTDKPMKCHLSGGKGYPPLAGVDCVVTVAPGSSVKRTLTCTPGSVVPAGF